MEMRAKGIARLFIAMAAAAAVFALVMYAGIGAQELLSAGESEMSWVNGAIPVFSIVLAFALAFWVFQKISRFYKPPESNAP